MKSHTFIIAYTAANVGLITYGVMALIQPDVLLHSFSAHVYQFPPEATNASAHLSGLYRLLGYFNIIPGVLGLLLLYRFWVTRERWYLKILIATTTFAYLGPVVFDNTLGTIGFFEILEHVLFVMILIAGLLMLSSVRGEELEEVRGEKLPVWELETSFSTAQNPESDHQINAQM